MLQRLRLLTAGESHGPSLTGILEGLPAGVVLTAEELVEQMRRRRHGHGRSPRQQLENDTVAVVGGLRYGVTTGAPLALRIDNQEHAAKWAQTMSAWPVAEPVAKKTVPRPGHADHAGLAKFGLDDVRDILERASARETAMRVALSVFCRALLRSVGITIDSHVVQIGAVRADPNVNDVADVDNSPVRCRDAAAAARMIALIDDAARAGETLGGSFVVVAHGAPVGLGSHTHWDRRLNARLSGALASIPSVKAVAVGDGTSLASSAGSMAHDALYEDGGSGARRSNRAGGIEGGMSNGEDIVVEVACKPLSTLPGGLPTVDLQSGVAARGLVERSDVCAVPSAAIVGEAMMALVVADALLEKFGGDSLAQLQAHLTATGVHR